MTTVSRWLRLTSPLLHGPDVSALQKAVNARLTTRGRHGIAVDGSYGPTTQAAVRSTLWFLGCPADQLDNGATTGNQEMILNPDKRSSAWLSIAKDRQAWLSTKDQGASGFLRIVSEYVGKHEDAGRQNRAAWLDPLLQQVGFAPATAPPYCAIGLIACYRKAGLDAVINSWAFTPAWLSDARGGRMGWKAVAVAERKPGDAVFFKFPGTSSYSCDHVGTVLDSDHTIEFNTSPGTGGSQDNGGGVYRRNWSDRARFAVGIARPPWS